MLVSEVIKLTVHFVYLKSRISHVFKQQEVEDTPKLFYNELGCERLPDVGFSGTGVLCQQLAQKVDTWRYRYLSTLIPASAALHSLKHVLAITVMACAVQTAAQEC